MSAVAKREEQLDLPAVPQAQPLSLLAVIERAARDNTIDVEKMERLVALHERTEARAAERSFNEAMNEVQTEIRPIAADASNPQTKSKYASYVALDRALRPIYTKHGFSLSFDTGESGPDTVKVLCYVAHSDGHSRTYQSIVPADGKGAKGGDVMTKTHATGAAYTYAQRYLMKLIFNIAVGDDDDGNSASGGDEVLTTEQVENVFDCAKRAGKTAEGICQWLKLPEGSGIPDIKQRDYERVIRALNLTERQKGGKP